MSRHKPKEFNEIEAMSVIAEGRKQAAELVRKAQEKALEPVHAAIVEQTERKREAEKIVTDADHEIARLRRILAKIIGKEVESGGGKTAGKRVRLTPEERQNLGAAMKRLVEKAGEEGVRGPEFRDLALRDFRGWKLTNVEKFLKDERITGILGRGQRSGRRYFMVQ